MITEDDIMITWISNNISTIIVSIILMAVIAVVIAAMVKNKKEGRSSCSCGCGGCAMKDSCHSVK